MSKKKPIFVIQKHKARSLHYDFRLEIDGVLKSWAIPKGPSLNPKDKHLAIMTEDHPMKYAKFEGIIPKGEYGAGIVMLWDTGTYKDIKIKNGKHISMPQCVKNGHIEVWLDGKKLKGGFTLIKMQTSTKNWLFIKMKDEYADVHRNIVKSMSKSIKSNRTLEEIAEERQ